MYHFLSIGEFLKFHRPAVKPSQSRESVFKYFNMLCKFADCYSYLKITFNNLITVLRRRQHCRRHLRNYILCVFTKQMLSTCLCSNAYAHYVWVFTWLSLAAKIGPFTRFFMEASWIHKPTTSTAASV